MNLAFAADELAFRDEARSFIAAHFPAFAAPYSAGGADEQRRSQALLARGWVAYKWPTEHGGTGLSITRKYIWERECALAGVPAQLGGIGIFMLAPVPFAHTAHWMFCLVRTSSEARRQDGISVLPIDMASPCVSVEPIVSIDGRHSVLNTVRLGGVRVPVDQRDGDEGAGWRCAKGLLMQERTGLACVVDSLRRLLAAQRVVVDRIAAARPAGRRPRGGVDAAVVAAVEAGVGVVDVTKGG
jgi:alkylation response protein AidB-like acyl-CoA dehydrogenase